MSLLTPPPSMRTAMRYRNPTFRWYAACKLWTDPVGRAVIDTLLPTDLPMIDIGCGIGQLVFYLREHGYTAPVFAIDTEARKVSAAAAIAERHFPDTVFQVMSADDPALFTAPDQAAGHIVMLDVLHYLDPAGQDALLRAMAEAAAPGAWVILRETPRDDGWRFRASMAEERMIEKIKWVEAVPSHYPTAGEIAAPFRERGFTCEVRPLWGKTPFNSYYFAFRKPMSA